MPDFPVYQDTLAGGTIHVYSAGALGSEARSGATNSSGVWPAANRAIYIPFRVETTVTAYQIAWENGAAVSGNLDVGIYDEIGNRLVSKGSTAQAGTTTIQAADITDTVLGPGLYYMAMCVDNTTAAVIRGAPQAAWLQMAGVQQQAVGAVTLPNPATFANPASAYLPNMCVALRSTI